MPRLFIRAAFALCAAAAFPAPVFLGLASTFDLGGQLVERSELRTGDWRLAAAGQSEQSLRLAAGVSSPWLRAGPLSPTGLLREACNPLGFRAGSDVFAERTGFALDESFPLQPFGIVVLPVARTLGVFYRSMPEGGEWLGCLASIRHGSGAGVEAFLSTSRPGPEVFGEDWLRDSAPFPGGRIVTAAARILWDSESFGCAATAGTSFGELEPPGGFYHLHLAARTGILTVYALLAQADSACRTPRGEHPREASAASCALLLADGNSAVDLRLARSVRPLQFSPGLFLAGRTEASCRIETTCPAAAQTLLSARVEGGRIVTTEADGSTEPSMRCLAAAGARISPVRLESTVSWDQTDYLSTGITADVTLDRRSSRASFSGSVHNLDKESQTLSALFSLRFSRKDFRLTFSAGMDDVRLMALRDDLARGARLSISWAVSEISGEESP